MSEQTSDVLDTFRIQAHLSQGELWLRYFELGGMSTALEVEVEAILFGTLLPTPHDHDVLAQALNERFVELGGDHPVPYTVELGGERSIGTESADGRRSGCRSRGPHEVRVRSRRRRV
jgi:hypothetical protein